MKVNFKVLSAITFAILAGIATFSMWAQYFWPEMFAEERCVLQAPNGDVVKSSGVACRGTDL
ncbi:hypothetical protein NDA01_27570 [Trichocoleus desertorum AS-A10]|uniref:hypothetical protein n=1 Tax=Trichocoleus desertorum TaxID=1481672 RepID=UPI00329A0343